MGSASIVAPRALGRDDGWHALRCLVVRRWGKERKGHIGKEREEREHEREAAAAAARAPHGTPRCFVFRARASCMVSCFVFRARMSFRMCGFVFVVFLFFFGLASN